MIDIFNKKKIKKLENNLQEVIKNRNYFENMYKEQVKHTNSLVKDNDYLRNENQKLIEWIQNILKVVNTSELSENFKENVITIPIYKKEEPYYMEGDWDCNKTKEDIYIPAIKIRQIRSIHDWGNKLC